MRPPSWLPKGSRSAIDSFPSRPRPLPASSAPGVGSDDRVALVHPNGPELAAAFLAVSSAAVCAPLDLMYRQSEYDFYLTDLRAKAIVFAESDDSPLRDLARRREMRILDVVAVDGDLAGSFRFSEGRGTVGSARGDDTALVLHTSGTTARPKLVPLTQGLLSPSAGTSPDARATPDDRCLNVMPLFHIHGLVAALLASLAAGASVVCTPGFDAARFFAWLAELEPTWYTAVPTIHQAVLERAPRPRRSSPRTGCASSARRRRRCRRRCIAELEDVFGAPVIEAYGMTEAAHQMACNPLPPATRKRGLGGPAAGSGGRDARRRRATARRRGEVGEIVDPRAQRDRAATRRTRRRTRVASSTAGSAPATRATLDDDGYLFLTGRLKEIINRGGEKVAPREVDEALLRHPAVAQAVTLRRARTRGSARTSRAAVVLRAGATRTSASCGDFVADAARADFKVPRSVVVRRRDPEGPDGQAPARRARRAARVVRSRGDAAALRRAAERRSSASSCEHLGRRCSASNASASTTTSSRSAATRSSAPRCSAPIAERNGRKLPLTTLMWAPTLGRFASLWRTGAGRGLAHRSGAGEGHATTAVRDARARRRDAQHRRAQAYAR